MAREDYVPADQDESEAAFRQWLVEPGQEVGEYTNHRIDKALAKHKRGKSVVKAVPEADIDTGTDEELEEHDVPKKLARQLATDHLKIDPDYYNRTKGKVIKKGVLPYGHTAYTKIVNGKPVQVQAKGVKPMEQTAPQQAAAPAPTPPPVPVKAVEDQRPKVKQAHQEPMLTVPVSRHAEKPAKSVTTPTGLPPNAVPFMPAPTGRPWVDKLEHLPESTYDAHFVNGEPTTERKKAVHDPIIAKFFDHVPVVPADQSPVAVMTIGGPASGKGCARKNLDKSQMVVIDPDDIKEMIPEYQEAVAGSAKNAAGMAHEESSYIAGMLQGMALAHRKSVLLDGTGKNPDKYQKSIEKLKKLGHHVTLLAVDLGESSEAIARVRARGRAEHTGRWVPDGSTIGGLDVFKEAYPQCMKTFMRVRHLVDEFAVYNNSGTEAVCTWTKSQDTEYHHVKEHVRQMHELYGGG